MDIPTMLKNWLAAFRTFISENSLVRDGAATFDGAVGMVVPETETNADSYGQYLSGFNKKQ